MLSEEISLTNGSKNIGRFSGVEIIHMDTVP